MNDSSEFYFHFQEESDFESQLVAKNIEFELCAFYRNVVKTFLITSFVSSSSLEIFKKFPKKFNKSQMSVYKIIFNFLSLPVNRAMKSLLGKTLE